VAVVHCSSREVLYLACTAGKKDRDGRPKGYRVEFAPGDGREFDSGGRPWHEERAALRCWSMVPAGVSPAERARQERERLGMVSDLDEARAAVAADRGRAEAAVEVVSVKGETKMKRKPKASLGLPKQEKGAAQVALLAPEAFAQDPAAVARKRARRSRRSAVTP
jgi:hypothetical protein